MKQILTQWLITLTLFSLLSTLLLKILPGKTYTPYIRLFSGFILILLFLSPVLSKTGLSDRLEINIRKDLFQLETKEMESGLIDAEETQKVIYEQAYETGTRTQILSWAAQKDYPITNAECTIQDNTIHQITITCEGSPALSVKNEIKNYIQDFYQVPPGNIHIKVENENGE